jgi:predicted metal-dependent HD superfamily phosphohydrolase
MISEILKKYDININLKEILNKWNEPHRGYHNIEHLKDLLRQIGKVDSEEKELLVLVSLFHDIIYEPNKNDNEEKSAEFFLNSTTNIKPEIELVYQTILDTKKHESSNSLSKKFNEMDMKVVTRGFNELMKWEEGIRKEYSMYSDSDYKKGRIEFLKSLLKKYSENKDNLLKLIDYVDNEINESINDDYILNQYGWNKAISNEEKLIESLSVWGTVAYSENIPPNLISDYSFNF